MGKSLVTLKLQICLAYFAFGENIEGQDYNIDPAVLFASSKVRTVGRLDRDSVSIGCRSTFFKKAFF